MNFSQLLCLVMPKKGVARRQPKLVLRNAKTLVLASPFLLICNSHAWSKESENKDLLTVEQIKEELLLIENLLEQQHPNFGFYKPTADVKNAFAQVRKSQTQPLSRQAFFDLAFPLVAQVKDSHTCLSAPLEIRRQYFDYNKKALPLLLTFHEDFAVLNRTHPMIAAGTKILEINDRTVPEIIEALADYSCQDGKNVSATLHRINQNFPVLYQRAFGESVNFSVNTVNQMGETTSVDVESYPLNAMSSIYSPSDSLRSFIKTRWKQNEETYYIKLRSFLVGKERFARSIDRVFKDIREKKAKHLILDLRGNGGGWVANASLMLAYLLNSRHHFPHYFHVPNQKLASLAPVLSNRKISKDKKELLEDANSFIRRIKRFRGRKRAFPKGLYALARSQAWGKKAYNGELHVLIDGGTYSAASMLAAQLRLKRKVTFYGDIAGGAPNRNCSSPHHAYALPHSGLKLQVAWNCNIEKLNKKPEVFKPNVFFVDEASDSRWKDRLLKQVYKRIAGKWFPPLPQTKPTELQ